MLNDRVQPQFIAGVGNTGVPAAWYAGGGGTHTRFGFCFAVRRSTYLHPRAFSYRW